jgi:Tfp pilus assembly protein PilN
MTQAKASADAAAQISKDINTTISLTQQMERDNQQMLNPRDSVSDLKLLTQSLPAASTFNTVDVSAAQININGITAAPERVIDYVRTLEASGKFKAANIVWIDRVGAGSNAIITFLITVVR